MLSSYQTVLSQHVFCQHFQCSTYSSPSPGSFTHAIPSLTFTYLSLTGHPDFLSIWTTQAPFLMLLSMGYLLWTEEKKKMEFEPNDCNSLSYLLKSLVRVGLIQLYSIHITQIHLPQKYNTDDQRLSWHFPLLLYFPQITIIINPVCIFPALFLSIQFESLIKISYTRMSSRYPVTAGWMNEHVDVCVCVYTNKLLCTWDCECVLL